MSLLRGGQTVHKSSHVSSGYMEFGANDKNVDADSVDEAAFREALPTGRSKAHFAPAIAASRGLGGSYDAHERYAADVAQGQYRLSTRSPGTPNLWQSPHGFGIGDRYQHDVYDG